MTESTSPLGKDLVGLEPLSKEQILTILDTAELFKDVSERRIKKVPVLRGKTIVNLFFEHSTRTRVSFELAEKRLSADAINFSASTSSPSTGTETSKRRWPTRAGFRPRCRTCAGRPRGPPRAAAPGPPRSRGSRTDPAPRPGTWAR